MKSDVWGVLWHITVLVKIGPKIADTGCDVSSLVMLNMQIFFLIKTKRSSEISGNIAASYTATFQKIGMLNCGRFVRKHPPAAARKSKC
jgi:hypothetical protein